MPLFRAVPLFLKSGTMSLNRIKAAGTAAVLHMKYSRLRHASPLLSTYVIVAYYVESSNVIIHEAFHHYCINNNINITRML